MAVFNRFPDITNPIFRERPVQNSVTQHIATRGPPLKYKRIFPKIHFVRDIVEGGALRMCSEFARALKAGVTALNVALKPNAEHLEHN